MNVTDWIKVFFTKEYKNFEISQLEFRKKILKSLQISINLFVIAFMAIVFPFQKVSLYYYIFLPTFLVLNNLAAFIVNKKKYQHWCPRYLFLLQILFQGVGVELSVTTAINFSVKRALFCGMQVGLIQTLSFLNISSSLLKFLSSVMLFLQILFKQITLEIEKAYMSCSVIVAVLIFVNFVYYRFEMLSFGVWNAYQKSNQGLTHFQKIIEIFPSQIIVLNKNSYADDKCLYSNREAKRLKEDVFQDREESLKVLLDLFILEQAPLDRSFNQEVELDRERITLKAYVEGLVARAPDSSKEFNELPSIFNNFKWEVKLGWIEWNQETALILIFNDISKVEKISELKNLDRNKDRVLATVSHELRTPLNAIIGMIDIAEEEIPSKCESVKSYLKIARESADSLSYMINNIIDMEQIRKGKLHLNLKMTRLNTLIEKVIPLIKIISKKKNLEFFYENKCPANTQLFVDPLRLQQVLMNLLENATKFTPSGFIKFSVNLKEGICNYGGDEQTRQKEQKTIKEYTIQDFDKEMCTGTKYTEEKCEFTRNLMSYDEMEESRGEQQLFVEISVEDSGVGIKEEKKNCLFKVFGKIDNNINTRGVGLGLAISQSLLKHMGSDGISVDSVFGIGSKFFFNIRAFIEKENCSCKANAIPDEAKKSISIKEFSHVFDKRNFSTKTAEDSTFKLLIVEDDEVNHLVVSLFLKYFGKIVTADKAYNGEEALKIILNQAENCNYYDLILMDCDMPIMDGFQATIAIKDFIRLRKIPDVKIIALTANASISNKEYCLHVGMTDVWNKPISKADFVKKLKDYMPGQLSVDIDFNL